MINLKIQIAGEGEKFINKASHLYGSSPESVACDLIAKGYDPEGKIKGVDISKAEGTPHHLVQGASSAKDKPAQRA